MPIRFYFDVENGTETIRDREGVEAADLAEVLAEARSVIQEMAGEVCADALGTAWTLVVRDATGTLLARLPIRR
ncbi:hypothetical protein AO398_15525 [Methylobacterium sp. GXS13]|uniref:DUF6894 family protein n=1 Tax=unclassified Methylobacterium TaxID=2615210 RepID=UPI00071B5FBC|nr:MULTISPECIES: hypothetical protein [unclassified Methylobacterium]KST60222.1 hypothetical protein AO398_15525 [Methylobacterium sp. GXS13]MCJ2119451.1 hypothetical protein [Methylobacterium sp. J-001]